MKKRKSLFFVAGEPSGDSHGAKLIGELRSLLPGDFRFVGLGGEKMAAAGMEVLFPLADYPIMGVWGIFAHLPTLSRAYRTVLQGLQRLRPEALVLIDYPGFNLQMARYAKKWKIPVVYYISPQVWAWWRSRMYRLPQRVDKMLVILPFEEELFRSIGLDAEYVGHPVWDELSRLSQNGGLWDEEVEALSRDGKKVIGLFPGSRLKEVKANLPLFLKVARALEEKFPHQFSFAIGALDDRRREAIQSIQNQMGTAYPVLVAKTHALMAASHFALVVSGTATLELLYFHVPMVVCYRADPISVAVGKRLLAIPHFSLPNILAQSEVVPEFALARDDWEPLFRAASNILEDTQKYRQCVKGLEKVARILARRENASYNAAKGIVRFLGLSFDGG